MKIILQSKTHICLRVNKHVRNRQYNECHEKLMFYNEKHGTYSKYLKEEFSFQQRKNHSIFLKGLRYLECGKNV